MSVVESLPDRPLTLEEVEAIKESEDIQCPATFTIPGAETESGDEDEVVGLIVLVGRTAFGLMYGDSWVKEVIERDVDPDAFGAFIQQQVDSTKWDVTDWDRLQ